MKAIEDLVFETNHHAYNLSAEMMNLEVIYKALWVLDDRIEEIIHKGFDEDITLARLSIGEIKDSIRLLCMAFHPLFTSLNESTESLNDHSSKLFNIVRDQTDESKKAQRHGNDERQ